MTVEIDAATQKVIDDFDGQAKKRAAELITCLPMHENVREMVDSLREMLEGAFCLGYKAGVIDLRAAQRAEAKTP